LTSAFVYKPHLMARLQGSGASGGTLTLEVLGSAGDTAWALYAFGAGPPLPVPPFGFGLVLDPATLAFLTGPHAIVQTDGLLTVVLPFPPAPQLAGAAVHLQLLVESPGGGAFSSSAQVVL
jgi:hypothetical protein